MKIKLSYFLGKRGANLAKFCNDNNIKNYRSLHDFLLENRVECPPEKEVIHIFKSAEKPAKNSKEAVQKLQKHKKVSKYSKKGSSHTVTSND